jgi:hypothetical protein
MLFASLLITGLSLGADLCPDAADCRSPFQASFYLGIAIDTFGGGEALRYLNPSASGNLQERGIAGIDIAYRLLGAPDSTKPKNKYDATRTSQLWIFGETVHGARSAEIDCKEHPTILTCKSTPEVPAAPLTDAIFILRNATSLEGFLGLRYEFLTLQTGTSAPANLYLKAQAGFVSVAHSGDDVKDIHHLGVGALVTKGDFEGSHLEVGWGRNDLFVVKPRGRLKVDGYLSKKITPTLSVFAQLVADVDGGPHADGMQSFIGFDWNLDKFDWKHALGIP